MSKLVLLIAAVVFGLIAVNGESMLAIAGGGVLCLASFCGFLTCQ